MSRKLHKILSQDLDHVLTHTQELWEELRDQRIFITGGTGFYGSWLLESLAWANDALGLNVKAVVLSREPDKFRAKIPHLNGHPSIILHSGNMVDFPYPDGEFGYVIHAASELSVSNPPHPYGLMEDTFLGIGHIIQFVRQRGVKKLLYTSSGAVYGPSMTGGRKLMEDDSGCSMPLEPRWCYGEAKRHGEMLCALAGHEFGFEAKIARGFAVIGPYLPLDAHFAAGNFIRDLLKGGPITLQGDGTSVRSYLYGADLAIWLWTILLRGQPAHPYHLGSDRPVSTLELAKLVAAQSEPPPAIQVLGKARPGQVVDYYVPDISRARSELGLDAWIGLPEAIHRTVAFHRR